MSEFEDYCRANRINDVVDWLRYCSDMTRIERLALADMLDRNRDRFPKKRGPKPRSLIPHVLWVLDTFVKPKLQEDLKAKQRELRKQGIPFSVEDVLLRETLKLVRKEHLEKNEEAPTLKALRAAYHNPKRYRKAP
jgi:hypothetical protein